MGPAIEPAQVRCYLSNTRLVSFMGIRADFVAGVRSAYLSKWLGHSPLDIVGGPVFERFAEHSLPLSYAL